MNCMKEFTMKESAGYTNVSNGILKGKNLSLKALGIYLLMVSRPDNWKFSVKGLETLCTDGRAGISSAVKELEDKGFVKRKTVYDKGKICGTEYFIYDRPMTEKPLAENPTAVNQSAENMPQTIKEETINEKAIINETNRRKREDIKREFRRQIDYDILSFDHDRGLMDMMTDIVADAALSEEPIKMGKREIPAGEVYERFRMIDSEHVDYIIDEYIRNGKSVRNPAAYLKTLMYNVPVTFNSVIEAAFRASMG